MDSIGFKPESSDRSHGGRGEHGVNRGNHRDRNRRLDIFPPRSLSSPCAKNVFRDKTKPIEMGGQVQKCVSMQMLQGPPFREDSRDSRALLRFSGSTMKKPPGPPRTRRLSLRRTGNPKETRAPTPKMKTLKRAQPWRRRRRTITVVRPKASRPQVAGSGTRVSNVMPERKG